jgi:hypothetical protein
MLTEQDVNRFQAQLSLALASGVNIRVRHFNTWNRPGTPNDVSASMKVPEFIIINP